jgi:Rha family phage regulatory protein
VFKTKKGNVATDSLLIAKGFGKRHDNVVQAYKNLEVSPEFNALNFKVVEYKDKKGQLRPKATMTKDGFTFLFMGFTGKRAVKYA